MADHTQFRRTPHTTIRLDGDGMLIVGNTNNSEVPANNTVLFEAEDEEMPELVDEEMLESEDNMGLPLDFSSINQTMNMGAFVSSMDRAIHHRNLDRSVVNHMLFGMMNMTTNHWHTSDIIQGLGRGIRNWFDHMREFQPQRQYDHANFKYVPEAFALPTVEDIVEQSMRGQTNIWRKLKRHFPGTTFESFADYTAFMQTPTFFRADQAPADEEDLYGNNYIDCDAVFVLVAPAECKSTLTFYSSEELVGTFLHYCDFVNPKNVQQNFTEKQMHRLSLIADEALHETIEYYLIHQSDSMKAARQMQTAEPEAFKECLELILEAGMYMRGWDGHGAYPLKSMQTVGQVNRVTLSHKLVTLKNKLEDAWSRFKDLQLMEPHGKNWRACKDTHNKLYKRIQIVMAGTHEESCIRLTSNRLTATAWFYLKELYEVTAFEIEHLRDIA